MIGFYLAFMAVLLAGFGARDQVLVAGLVRAQGARPGVLIVALLVTIATALFAAWAASTVAPLLSPRARVFLAATALVFAGVEALLLPMVARVPKEPTLSLGALAIALVAFQAVDAARFLVFAITVATSAPVLPALGGVLAGGALLFGAWFAPEVALNRWTRPLRKLVGGILLIVGIVLGLRTTVFL